MKLALLVLGLAWPASLHAQDAAQEKVSFEREVVPLLRARCHGCHQPAKAKGKLNLTRYDSLMRSEDPVVVPGKPEESLLLELVMPFDDEPPEMPEDAEPLSAEEIDVLRRWIAEGAVDDSTAKPGPLVDAEHPPVYPCLPVVTSLAYSPDGSMLAVTGWHEVFLYPTKDKEGLPLARLVGLSPRIESICFSPDGTHLAVGCGTPGMEGELQLWSVEKKKLVLSTRATFDTLRGLSWSPDGSRIAFGCADRSLRVVEAKTGKQVLYQATHEDWVLGTAWSLDGSFLVSVSRDRSLKLVEVATEQFIDNITSITPGAVKGGLMSVRRHPERDELLVGGADGIPKAYRMHREQKRVIGDDYNLLRNFPSMHGLIYAVEWSPDGSRVAAVSGLGKKGEVCVANAEDGAEIWRHEFPFGVYALSLDSSGTRLALAGDDGIVREYALQDGSLIRKFPSAPVAAKKPGPPTSQESAQ
jgi:Tol biopolymer transport system component